MSKRDAWVFMLTALVFGLVLVVLVGAADAKTPFGYRYLGTVGWVPGSGYVNGTGWNASAYYALDTGVAFGRRPDLVALASPADFRIFPLSATYIANAELMKVDLTAGQVDSLMAGAQAIPAVGKVFYGFFPWFVAHATSDTVWIDGYEEE